MLLDTISWEIGSLVVAISLLPHIVGACSDLAVFKQYHTIAFAAHFSHANTPNEFHISISHWASRTPNNPYVLCTRLYVFLAPDFSHKACMFPFRFRLRAGVVGCSPEQWRHHSRALRLASRVSVVTDGSARKTEGRQRSRYVPVRCPVKTDDKAWFMLRRRSFTVGKMLREFVLWLHGITLRSMMWEVVSTRRTKLVTGQLVELADWYFEGKTK